MEGGGKLLFEYPNKGAAIVLSNHAHAMLLDKKPRAALRLAKEAVKVEILHSTPFSAR